MTEKHETIITLPGGVTNYVDTLHSTLDFVDSSTPTRDELAQWFLDTFSGMSSSSSANDKARFVEQLEVIEKDATDHYELTPTGEKLRTAEPEGSPEIFYNHLSSHYIGFETILQALADQPRSLNELTDLLNEIHEKDWESIYQAEYRVNWLRSLHLVDKDGDKVTLTNRGEELASTLDFDPISGREITAPANGPDPQSHVSIDEFGDEVSYYWVNQSNDAERTGGYLRSQDTYYTRDLTKLEVGDVLVHYWDGAVRAYSVVTSQAYQIPGSELEQAEGEEEYWSIDVDMHELDPVRKYETIESILRRDEIKQGKEKYAINKAGIQSWYLCNLTKPAMRYLLETYPDSPSESNIDGTQYFWATANPKIWKPESIAGKEGDDSRVFYAAENSKGNKKRIYDAFDRANPGDQVLFYESSPTKKVVAVGVVATGLHENEEGVPGISIEYDRPVNGIGWDDVTAVDDLESSDPVRNGARGSLFELSPQEYEAILALEMESKTDEEITRLQTRLELPQVPVSLPDNLYFENRERLRREISAALEAGKHIIFTGPPGTGKTKIATHVSKAATELDAVDDYRFTTATADWTAYDTVGGYIPVREGGGQELVFEPRLFLQCFRDSNGIKNEWLVIDELNRADIDKAMGQLFSVLSGDSTELPYERDQPVEVVSVGSDPEQTEKERIAENTDVFPVTSAWRLLATMNTYDKASLYELSYAFMRRFAFIRVGIPNLETEDGHVRTDLLDPSAGPNYATGWIESNPDLKKPLDEWGDWLSHIWHRVNGERAIGPALIHDMIRYLAAYDGRASSEEALTSAVVTHVFPQLEGIRQETQRAIIDGLCACPAPLSEARLWKQANDFLGLPSE